MKGKEKEIINNEEEEIRILGLDFVLREEKQEEIPASAIVNEIVNKFQTGKNQRREREQKWIEYLNAYYLKNIQIPTPPQEWRSKVIPPKNFYVAEQFVSIIRKSLLQSKDFFSLAPAVKNEELEKIGLALRNLVEYYMKTFNFLEEFENALRWGVLTGEIILKINWKTEIKEIEFERIVKSYPVFQAISPFDFVADEFQRWACERYFLDLPTIYEFQKLGIWRDFPLSSFAFDDKEDIYAKTYADFSQKEGLAEVIEFWGDLYLQNKVLRNQHIIVVNRKHLAYADVQRFYHNSIPFVFAHLFEPLKGQYGFGIYDAIMDLLKSYTKLFRLLEDNVALALGTIIEVDETRLSHSTRETIKKEGLIPFSILYKTGEEEVMQGKTYVSFNPNVLPFIQLYSQEIENTTGLTDVIRGLPVAKGRPTAKEIMIRTQQSIAMMDAITLRIEKKILNEIIFKLLALIVQKEETGKILSILSQEYIPFIAPLLENRIELFKLIEERLVVSVYGLSEVMHRQEKIDKLIALIELAQQVPNFNVKKIIEKLGMLFGFLPEEFLVPDPSPQEIEMQKLTLKELAKLIMFFQLQHNEKIDFKLLLENFPPDVLLQAAREILEGVKQ